MNSTPIKNICLYTANEKSQSISFNYFNSLFESQPNIIIHNIQKNHQYNMTSFTLNNISIVFHSLNQMNAIEEGNCNTEELMKNLDDFFTTNYQFNIDILFVVYSETIRKQIHLLIKKWDKCVFIIFPMDSKDFSDHPHCNKFQIGDANIIPALVDMININFVWRDDYQTFNEYSKEKYYSTYALYSKRRQELMNMNKNKQINLFNEFEKFSFDYDYCADDCIILLQLFNHAKDKLTLYLKNNYCNQCKSRQSICTYDKKSDGYLCGNCTQKFIQNTMMFKCIKCMEQYQKTQSERFVVTLCCNTCYCIECLREQVNLNKQKAIEKKNLRFLVCFCGDFIDSFVIQYIVGDSNYKSTFKFAH